MAFYYLFAGLVADFALVANMVIILGIMSMIEATFTLPGIAGLVLTIGMAVDANVLIFERIREEREAGSDLPTSVRTGLRQGVVHHPRRQHHHADHLRGAGLHRHR